MRWFFGGRFIYHREISPASLPFYPSPSLKFLLDFSSFLTQSPFLQILLFSPFCFGFHFPAFLKGSQPCLFIYIPGSHACELCLSGTYSTETGTSTQICFSRFLASTYPTAPLGIYPTEAEVTKTYSPFHALSISAL